MLKKTLVNTKNFLRNIKNYQQIPDMYWAEKIVEYKVSFKDIEIEPDSGNLLLKPLGISLDKGTYEFLLDQKVLNQAKSMQKKVGAKFYLTEDNQLVLEVEGMKAFIQTEQDILIAQEIFILGIYNLIYPHPTIVLDIGMNVGFVSLYFAAHKNVHRVFGYEPFKMTYQQAINNISLNPELSDKIEPCDYGIGGKDEKLTIEYDYEYKGSIGVNGLAQQFKKDRSKPLMKEEICLKSITEVVDSIRLQHPGLDIVAKIDCEGSEYAIINALAEKGQLNFIKAMMIEWHEKGPDLLSEPLKKAGFAIFSRLPKSTDVGLLYAVRVGS